MSLVEHRGLRRQRGGTLLGFMLGLVLGLAVAVVVALFITRATPSCASAPPLHSIRSRSVT